ncbi:MAG TPA: TonB-dependent receptor, partial [Solibacterales bacterium]|nr:TonB-dependent receptor [Bryobacterales bacterium]
TVVQVSEQAGQINTETQTVGTVVTTKQVLELPTLTRNPYSLVAISGNVSPDDPSGRGTGYAINGLRSAGTNALLDGAANNDEFTASVGQQVPLDSIQEFSILTNNFTAEFGRAAAGVVNVATRSGSNDLHGTAYWFNRLSRLSSNDFDNNANGITRPIFTRNQPGYSVGGPVKKDKLFFFQSTEWIRTRSAGIRNVWIPTPELIARTAPSARGFFQSLGNRRTGLQTLETLNRTQLAARGANICAGQAATGLCNSLPADLPVFSRVSYSRPADSGGGTPTNTHFGVARLDYNLSEKTQIYGRLAWESISNLVGSNADSPYAGFDSGSDQRNYNLLVSAIRTFSPTLISQSKAVVNRLKNIQPLGDQPPTPTLYLASGSTATRLLGNLVAMPGYLPFNPGSAIPFGGPQNFAQLYEDLSWSKGAHQIRMGATFTYQQDNRTFGAFQNPVQQVGNNFGRGMENLLAGQLFQFQAAIDPQGKFPCNGPVTPQCSVNLPVGFPNFSRSNRYKEFGLYIQDAWKISRNVSLNLGVRYEYFGVQKNKNPRLDSNFYPAQGQTEFLQLRNGDVAIAPNSYVGGLWKPDWNNFGPRLGFAWDVFGNGNTSLRGGYGLSYERNFGNVTFNVIQNPPNYAVISVQPVDVGGVINITTALAGPLAGNVGTKGVPPTSLRAVNPEIRTAYAQFWSLSLEHQIVRNVLFAIDYSGSKGSKLYSLENPNRVGAGNVLLGDACTTGSGPGAPGNCTARLLRNTGYTNINMRNGKGFSNYNSMNARFTVRNVGNSGVNLISNYTWGHAIDNLSDTFSSSGNQYNLGLLDPFNPRLDKGDAYFDNRHRWALSGQWEVPFARGLKGVANKILHGWSIAPILTARTGSPFTLYDTTWAGILNAVYPRA